VCWHMGWAPYLWFAPQGVVDPPTAISNDSIARWIHDFARSFSPRLSAQGDDLRDRPGARSGSESPGFWRQKTRQTVPLWPFANPALSFLGVCVGVKLGDRGQSPISMSIFSLSDPPGVG